MTYPAESADLYKAILEMKNGGYLGECYVNFDNEAGSYLELRIGMAAGGTQDVMIRFANGSTEARSMQLSLNGEPVLSSMVFDPTNDRTNWDTLSVQVRFVQGVNYLRLTSTGSAGGPRLFPRHILPGSS